MRLEPVICLLTCAALVLGTPQAARADTNYDLIQAAYNGNPARVAQLVSKGANVNARDDYGYTPLMWAAQQGHNITSEALIKKGAEVDAQDKQGHTALLIATVKGHENVVRVLLKYKADPNIKAQNGVSALEYARIYKLNTLRKLMESALANPQATRPTPKPMPVATPKPMAVPTRKPIGAATPKPPAATPKPNATQAPAVTGTFGMSAQAREAINKLHGKFMDHLGLRDPEAIVQKGFNQDLEDKLDQIFLALDYGHTSNIARAKLADARKLVNSSKQLAAQPDPQDDRICRQILTSLDDMLRTAGY
ncbi:MAG: hypothetical protein JWM80_5183 [Cyanobacteria bacterium RYN_339]|nr:hypothetical protein [Cyanobacteria bacterium RYN_339]